MDSLLFVQVCAMSLSHRYGGILAHSIFWQKSFNSAILELFPSFIKVPKPYKCLCNSFQTWMIHMSLLSGLIKKKCQKNVRYKNWTKDKQSVSKAKVWKNFRKPVKLLFNVTFERNTKLYDSLNAKYKEMWNVSRLLHSNVQSLRHLSSWHFHFL